MLQAGEGDMLVSNMYQQECKLVHFLYVYNDGRPSATAWRMRSKITEKRVSKYLA